MKRVIDLLTALVLVALLVFVGCKKGGDDDDDDDDDDDQTVNVVGTWSTTEATFEGSTARPEFVGITVTFTETEVSATGLPTEEPNAADVWPSTAVSYTINGSVIERGDDVDMTIVSSSDTELELNFDVEDSEAARVAGVVGNWTFTLDAQ